VILSNNKGGQINFSVI